MKIQFVQNLHKLRMMEKHTIISSIHLEAIIAVGVSH